MWKLSTNQKIVFNSTLIVLYFLTGIFFYSNVEGWSALDSLYFSIVTISTVGYGDMTPSTDGSRVFTIFYMLFGIYIIFYTLYHYTNRGVKKMRQVLRDRQFSTASVSHLPSIRTPHGSHPALSGIQEEAASGDLPRRNTFDFFFSNPANHHHHHNHHNHHNVHLPPLSGSHPARHPHQHHHHHEEDKNAYASAISTTTEKYYERRKRVYLATCALLVLILLGATVLCLNEGWSFVTALFFAVETSTTVGYGDIVVKYDSTKGFLIVYILISASIVVYILNTMHSMQKSYQDVKKRRKALQQKKSFEESWHELQKMIASMSEHHVPQLGHIHMGSSSALSSHQPSFSGSAHNLHMLHYTGPPMRTFTNFSTTESPHDPVDDHFFYYGNHHRNISTDSTATNAMNISQINEFQFVIFILRHLQIIDDKKHIQPWIKKFRDLDKQKRGYLTIEQLRDFCKVDAAKTEAEIIHMEEVLHPATSVLAAMVGGDSKHSSRRNSRAASNDIGLSLSPSNNNNNNQHINAMLAKSTDCENPLQQQLLHQDVFRHRHSSQSEHDHVDREELEMRSKPSESKKADEADEESGDESDDEEGDEEEE